MIELTTEQQALLARELEPVSILDPRTQKRYVLIQAEVYEQLKSALETDVDPRLAYPLLDRIMAEDDAGDPALESYQVP